MEETLLQSSTWVNFGVTHAALLGPNSWAGQDEWQAGVKGEARAAQALGALPSNGDRIRRRAEGALRFLQPDDNISACQVVGARECARARERA